MNRLARESSPYLLQHAGNPVDWYPWGDEAFDEARRSGKPVFLSVGYSTCHWCHVMEAESFEDPGVARVLNERFVSIKVDREERPDVDAVYMTAVQALTRHGGWPMSVWLDAERRPFYGGTYFPREAFVSVLERLAEIYRADPQRVAEAAESITEMIRATMSGAAEAGGLSDATVLDGAARWCARAYDAEHGGVRGAPKFPSSFPVRLLLREHRRSGDPAALAMASHTLEAMAAGGMHDQLGGGFHRYSTDERWLVPHFEKMLYDNALLALAYTEAWQVTGRRDFERVARTTLDYVLREMTAPEGGFFSATDADSEGEEGTFFVWSAAEVRSVLGDEAERFSTFYAVTERGNFEGKNVLFVPRPDEDEWAALSEARERMRLARELRPHPSRDDKVLAGWNGLMISAMASAGRVFAEPRYVAAAVRACDFVLGAMRCDGRLQRSWRDGRVSGPGFLEDDAFVVAGLLDTYEATFERRFLAEALALAQQTQALFADRDGGAWYRTADDHEMLVARERPNYDGAEPSGASVATMNALRLATLTGDAGWREIAERALRAYATQLREQPAALHELLIAVEYLVDTPREIILVWPPGGDASAFLERLRHAFVPNRALLGAAKDAVDALAHLAPIVAGKTSLENQATAYVCEHGACQLPTNDPEAMMALLA